MKTDNEVEIRYVQSGDGEFWFSLDKHISVAEFEKKVRDKQGYILSVNGDPVGLLRYNLFWDNTPFCTMLYFRESYRGRGYGRSLLNVWENDMRKLGYRLLLVSTQADESAQYFYRKCGYSDCGSLSVPDQAEEPFLLKILHSA